jgi:hypothetical protein
MEASAMKPEQAENNHRDIPIVPRECGGKWVAWSHDGARILATDDDLAKAEQAARAAGENRPRMERVPRSEVRIVGGARR